MGVQVTFDYGTWSARYTDLAPYIPQNTAQACFNEACLYQANDGSGPINDPVMALTLLNMLTAHIAALNFPVSGPTTAPDPSSPLVGRISNAAEGSVNVTAENDYPPGTPQWYQQTKYGAAWWEATSGFRNMRYLPPRRATGPWGPFGFYNGGRGFPGQGF